MTNANRHIADVLHQRQNPAWPLVNQQVCDVYGLDPGQVREVNINFHPAGVPIVTVQLMCTEGVLQMVYQMLGEGDPERDFMSKGWVSLKHDQ